ncbi:MAG: type II secretion system secretin GspD [SAR86 cluster bacterium]|uniref:Type II secretion system secretin GspD n=1 Tax=SAR86 cluster bacterium TaxID=2030880 RepID=A0A937SHM7_9GAMM|nr:type II secretion system secretin GspD [SAR86 cluster bacterium]MDC0873030.1 type II secretion system secretin GspD [Gammaproteobacteria bacterium]MDG2093106.1 type II secretion system secretin GspD [SAR86 cluster bacterium]
MNRSFKLLFYIFLIGIPSSVLSQDAFVLNYEDADIKKVSQDIARFAKKTIILDPRVKGKITIYSNASLDSDQVWDVYLRTIQVNGFSSVADNGVVRIVPENEATRDENDVNDEKGNFLTSVIPLVNRSAAEILPMIKPITGRQSHLSSIPSINSILIVDRLSNVERIRALLKDLDKDNSAKISIIKLDNLSSIEAVRILEKLKAQNNPTINNFVAIPFSPSNSVILSANSTITTNIQKTLTSLDADVKADKSIDVIYLKYAKAEDISTILNSVSDRFAASPDGIKTVITHHEKTNSLIVSSEESNLPGIRNLISKLDIRRAQVLVEAIIVELSETAAQNLGIETLYTGDGEVPIGITSYDVGSGPDLLAIAGSAASDGADATLSQLATSSLLGSQGLVAGFGDFTGAGNFAGILSAVANDQNSNILSTPSVIAMDNTESKLLIGQEIPITTGESLGSSNVNAFRTTSREEVGIKLTVTPQINEGSSVILRIEQEVSSVAGTYASGVDLITNNRTIETTVLADNGQIIVLGGLIDEDIQENISKVPLLGSLPVIGKLFQSSSTQVIKKKLFVFIRPTILIDSDSINELSAEKYNFIKARQLTRDSDINLIDLTESN